RSGEVEWRIEDVCADLDRLLSTGKFVGIGEFSPYMPIPADRRKLIPQTELIENMLAICDVGNKHGVTVGVHSGCPMGYDVAYSSGSLGPINFNPLMVHDLAAAFPNLKIIIDHGGMQGWWSEKTRCALWPRRKLPSRCSWRSTSFAPRCSSLLEVFTPTSTPSSRLPTRTGPASSSSPTPARARSATWRRAPTAWSIATSPARRWSTVSAKSPGAKTGYRTWRCRVSSPKTIWSGCASVTA